MHEEEPVDNPLSDSSRQAKTPESCILVIFGATGDLTARKLIPALYNLAKDGQLPAHFACVGFARREMSHESFRDEMAEAIAKYSRTQPIDQELWKRFKEQLYYLSSNFDDDEGYEHLQQFLIKLDSSIGTKGNRVYYLSVQPSYFSDVAEKLKKHNLIYPLGSIRDKWSRVIIEKPFGKDLASAKKLQVELTQFLDEQQIYRIDHYLGKETVQNLLVFRFGNPIFEAIWNNKYIDNIQITVAEEIGIGSRGRFWEEAGLLRDVIQNHMMQLLTLVAMEPPANMQAWAIRDEKVKVLESIRPFDKSQFHRQAVRGQYDEGFINGEPVKKYRDEANVDPNSSVETFAALKLFIDNWRWAGVPFYLRAGKRVAKRSTKIVISFKHAPGFLFHDATALHSNVLGIRIQPDEGISLKMNCKVPALPNVIQPVKMDFHYNSYFGTSPPEAYERLIIDCICDDSTLFARDDEVFGSWKHFTPLLDYWYNGPSPQFPNYSSGSWGPTEADQLLREDGLFWRLV